MPGTVERNPGKNHLVKYTKEREVHDVKGI